MQYFQFSLSLSLRNIQIYVAIRIKTLQKNVLYLYIPKNKVFVCLVQLKECRTLRMRCVRMRGLRMRCEDEV